MDPTAKEQRELRDALLVAFPGENELARMVQFSLGENLEAITEPDNLTGRIEQLIRWAVSRGRLAELIAAAREANQGNRRLADFAARFEARLAQSRGTGASGIHLAELSGVPELPQPFIARPQEQGPLEEKLRAGLTGTAELSEKQRRLLVHGMGGIGKSVLASALVRSPGVRELFPEGIFWVTVGQNPAIPTLQADLADRLDAPETTFRDEQHGREELTRVLAGRAILLVLDDVWRERHVPAFGTPGTRCRVLITSRKPGLVPALGTRDHQSGLLSDEQALALLAEKSEQPLDKLPEEAGQVARECGYLPLAVAMAASMAHRKPDRWPNVLHRLRSADLEKIREEFPDYPYPNLLATIEASVEELEPADQARYFELAVFPEDAAVPEAALRVLWKLDEYDSDDLVDRLTERSLGSVDAAGQLSLHDLLRDFVRKRAAELPGGLPALHDRLLSAYRRARGLANWPDLPGDEPYLWDHLAYHLSQAGHQDDLRALLLDFNWQYTRLGHRGPNALLADFDHLPADEELRLVQGTVRLSAHLLARDANLLPGQLLGRLLGFDEPGIRGLIGQAKGWRGSPWLRPLARSLAPASGPLLRTLYGHTNWVSAVAVLPDGRRAISASYDGTLKLWDIDTAQEIRALSGHAGAVNAVAVLPDGRRVISASSDNTVMLWDVESGDVLASFGGDSELVACAAATDGRTFAAGEQSGRLHFLRLEGLD